jgi:hypothetical protein
MKPSNHTTMKPHTSRFTLPAPEFQWAGFTFPKWLFTLPNGSIAKRLRDSKVNICSPYFHSPNPNDAGTGTGFYLDSDGMPGLRWYWADECCSSIEHTGWYTQPDGNGDKIRGIVMRLPRSRGFLAGWSMGESMASEVDSTIYMDERSAALAADSMAQQDAERECEAYERDQAETLNQ